ncbi:MAG: alpha/beta fold hydrolase [Gammaproteobacteria bacterium]|nr:alpha/beta fold hydrolase [Gammaproteobacteria bacterium]
MTNSAAAAGKGPFKDAVLSQEGAEHRHRLRQELQLTLPLTYRRVFRVGKVHCELYENDRPEAPVILFLAGIGTYCELYARLLHGLSRQGFHVVGVDLRGHGYSDGERGVLTVETAVADLSVVIDALETRFTGPFSVYGYSIGATLGASLCVADERVAALFCTTLLMPEVPPDPLHQIGWHWTRVSAFWFPGLKVPLLQFIDFKKLIRGVSADAVDDIEDDPLLVDSYPLKTLSSLFNTPTGLMTIGRTLPVAIMHGDVDEVLPLSYSERVCASMSQPIELIRVGDHGHMIPWDNVELNISLVAQWMRVHGMGAAGQS